MKANRNLEARLDFGNYTEAELIRIDVPLNLPYTNDWAAAERIDGSINYHGQDYKFVKRIFTNGVMSYWCIAQNASKHISEKATDYFGKINGLPTTESPKKSTGIKKSFSDFEQDIYFEHTSYLFVQILFQHQPDIHLPEGFIYQQDRPPII